MLFHTSDCSTISDGWYLFSLNGCLFKMAVLRSGLSEKETYISNTGELNTDSIRIWAREKQAKRQRVLKHNRKWLRGITGAFVWRLNCIHSNCNKENHPSNEINIWGEKEIPRLIGQRAMELWVHEHCLPWEPISHTCLYCSQKSQIKLGTPFYFWIISLTTHGSNNN